MSVADSFAGFADSMASIASLPAEAQKDMIEYVRDLRELLAGGMLTGAGRLDFSLYCAPRGLLSSCSAPLPHRPSCGVLLLCVVSSGYVTVRFVKRQTLARSAAGAHHGSSRFRPGDVLC